MGLFLNVKTVRVITLLRRTFPGKWVYRKHELYTWWNVDQGWGVRPAALSTPRHENDDESWTTIYVRSDTGARLYL